jgi:hypothetical protein
VCLQCGSSTRGDIARLSVRPEIRIELWRTRTREP